jgi:hypothetical protein
VENVSRFCPTKIGVDENKEDVDHFIDLYGAVEQLSEADGEPIPKGIDVLFRSAVVLMVSHWEAYVEDICSEALTHLVNHLPSAENLPKELKKKVAKELSESKNELAMWEIADEGWRALLLGRLSDYQAGRDRSFNTPKSQNTADFVRNVLGIKDIRSSWKYEALNKEPLEKKLDQLIAIRSQIAHRGKIEEQINREWVEEHIKFLQKVVSSTGGEINRHLKKLTGKPLW